MTNVLLYGATGFSGELIARELADECRLVLAGRDADRLHDLADELDAEYRTFTLDSRKDVRNGLRDMDVVLNAAGPFAYTAERLAKVALEVGCHYVDINGEADVYQRLDDLSLHAAQRDCVMVCGGGFWAAASNLLLDHALNEMGGVRELGAVRIAMSRINTFSRGSVETVWRSFREEVTVVRRGEEPDRAGNPRPQMVIRHEPVGKLERRFDFGKTSQENPDIRVASAVSLVDTLVARVSLERKKIIADGIESYIEMDDARRMLYQLTALAAPIAAFPWFRDIVQQPIEMLAAGPREYEREDEPHVVLLEIEDRFRRPIVRWRWETPNVYQFTAQIAAEIALRVTDHAKPGWATPAEVLAKAITNLKNATHAAHAGPLRDCVLEKHEV